MDGQAAIINLPTSYPPSGIDGIHIAGGPGAEQTGYTSPAVLESELEEKYDYAVHPEKMSLLSGDDTNNECIPEIYQLINSRFDVLEDELERGEYEIIHVTVFYLNMLQHFYWDMDVVKRAWEIIDKRVGQLLHKKELDNLFVMSDHGSNRIETTFRINTWLEQNGYLETTSSVSDYLHKAGITQERIRPILAKFGVEWWARRLLPERVQMLLPDETGSVDKSAKGDVMDWEKSQAVASGQGPVYVLATDRKERQRIVEKLIPELEALTAPDGAPVFDEVLRGKDVYSGPYIDQAPDIVLDQAKGVHIEGKIGDDEVFGAPGKWHGENKDTGMFIGYGPDIDETAKISDMHILDIAPTILHLHGEAVPERMDGEVRRELFRSESKLAEKEVTRLSVEDLDEEGIRSDSGTLEGDVTDRLEDLGYLE
jgi:predicted AlkP superfamily phosphohydrolase/phosphomutase